MSHMAPGEGSPVDNPNATPEVPYEPQQGTGRAKKSQKQVDKEQAEEQDFIAPSDAMPHTDVDGKAIPDEPEKPKSGKHAKKK
jgi:hypothetical protein